MSRWQLLALDFSDEDYPDSNTINSLWSNGKSMSNMFTDVNRAFYWQLNQLCLSPTQMKGEKYKYIFQDTSNHVDNHLMGSL